MSRVGDCQLLVAFDNDEIFVIVERRLMTKVVAASDNDTVVRKRIYHHHLVVNDGKPRVQKLFRPTLGNNLPIECFGTDDAWILLDGRLYTFHLFGWGHTFQFVVKAF